MLVLRLALFHFTYVLFQVVESSEVLLDDDVGDFFMLGVRLAEVFVVTGDLDVVLGAVVAGLTDLPYFVQDLLYSCHGFGWWKYRWSVLDFIWFGIDFVAVK